MLITFTSCGGAVGTATTCNRVISKCSQITTSQVGESVRIHFRKVPFFSAILANFEMKAIRMVNVI